MSDDVNANLVRSPEEILAEAQEHVAALCALVDEARNQGQAISFHISPIHDEQKRIVKTDHRVSIAKA